MLQAIWIPGWHPTPLNKLLGNHFAAARLKTADRQTIDAAVKVSGVSLCDPPRRRKVDLHLSFPKGQRTCDKDAYWKTCLDSLVRAKVLHNDSPAWCVPGSVHYFKTHESDHMWGTLILVEDIR